MSNDNREQRRRSISEALNERSSRLAGMYVTALRELDSSPSSVQETARISIICHCMRELMNGLPAIMAASVTPRPDPSSNRLAARLPDLLAKHSDLDLRAEQDMVPVPREVARAIADLVSASVMERGLNMANAAALLTDGTDTGHPLINQWKAAQSFFIQWTHLDRNLDGSRVLPTNDKIELHIRVVEDVIEVRTNMFFENLSAVEDILRLANAQDGEDRE